MKAVGRKPKLKAAEDRIIQADVVRLIQRKYGVSHPTAMSYLRTSGPEAIARMSVKVVWYRKSEVETWLAKG